MNRNGEIIKYMKNPLNFKCNLCPRDCGAHRYRGKLGYCKETSDIVVARAALHFWEEPCISGKEGSGAIFFSGCSLKCVFCQNRDIAIGHKGETISTERLVEIFFELEKKGANNINLVTPTHYILQIREAIILAKKQGIKIPFVYNTSSYEKKEYLALLKGLIDIYLPDFKYYDTNLAQIYSNAPDYFEVACDAVEEMVRQVGTPEFDDNGLLKKGVIVRHLILPGHTKDSKKIIEYLYSKYSDKIFISVMNQYTPWKGLDIEKYPELSRKITKREYEKVVSYALELGVSNAFIQEGDTAKESFIPEFDLEGVHKNE